MFGKLARSNKTMVALFSLIVSVILVITKVTIAIITNSIGVFSEALNNGLDLVTVLIAFLAIRMSLKPPDKDHTYGHGKYENLSAAVELIIISLLSLFIIYRSIQRIIYRDFQLNINNYIFIVLIISVILNIIRVYFVGRAAKTHRSSVFEAEFLNYTTDIVSSIVIIAGLLFSKSGFLLADPIASIIVSIAVLIFGLRLSIKVFRNLLDYIPVETTDRIIKSSKSFKEIKSINELRIHEVGNIKFINLNINLEKNLYLSQVEKIKERFKQKIEKDNPGCRIILETKTDYNKDDIYSKIKEIILNYKNIKDIHNINIYQVKDQIDISVHVQLVKELDLSKTERLTKKVENELKNEIILLRSIYIHIEEANSRQSWKDITSSSKPFINRIKKEVKEYAAPSTCHNFTILKKNNKYNIAFHCRLEKDMKVDQAHSVITMLEDIIRKKFKNIEEISIHVEPDKR
ncbi:MAG: cation-efflux pump [Actinobacteria bacterium]|nr:cation-efflux pump [Actinomycetota bacterium]